MSGTYRPWGRLDWAMHLTRPRRWNFIGALGTEERSLTAWQWMAELGLVGQTRLLEIWDAPSHHTPLAHQLMEQRFAEFQGQGGKAAEVERGLQLLAQGQFIVELAERILLDCLRGESPTTSVVLDITSLPKRYFFPLLRLLEQSDPVRDLVITSTAAESYEENENLSEHAPDGWKPLPGFLGQNPENSEMLIVTVGFMVESLANHLSEIKKHESVKMLIPFPAPLSLLRRTWESVYRLEAESVREKFTNYRVSPEDISGTFDRIISLARESQLSPAFAPFGPKPNSAAICLFASQTGSAVYYPQPSIYHPCYSRGVRRIDGKPAVTAHWVKHDGRRLYQVHEESKCR